MKIKQIDEAISGGTFFSASFGTFLVDSAGVANYV